MKRLLPRRVLFAAVACCVCSAVPCGGQVIAGVLLDSESGAPIPVGDIAVVDSAMKPIRAGKTDLRGRFSIRYTHDQPVMVYASALSYRAYLDGPFDIAEGDTLVLEFRIDPQPLSVDSIFVSVDQRQRRLEVSGFYERRRSALGGVFLEYSDLENKPATRTSDFFVQIPGVTVVPVGGGLSRARVLIRNRCQPNLFVDGVKVGGGRRRPLIDEIVRPEEIEGIEIYRSSSQTPTQFDQMDSRCGAILIWTH